MNIVSSPGYYHIAIDKSSKRHLLCTQFVDASLVVPIPVLIDVVPNVIAEKMYRISVSKAK